jgi:hypothetical protein
MPRNIYISHGTLSEQNLLADLIEESIKIFGHDVFYIPRKIVKLDRILNEDVLSNFPDAYMIEMYVESVDGFEGDGKLITKFNLEIRDQMTLVVSVRRFNELVGRFGTPTVQVRPQEGDLIYMPKTKGLFMIKFVEDKKPFFQLNNTPTYKLIVELFEYNNQMIDTGIDEIDQIQGNESQGFMTLVTYDNDTLGRIERGDKIIITFSQGVNGSAEILNTETTNNPNVDKVYIGPITYDNGIFRPLGVGAILLCEETNVTAAISDIITIAEDEFGSDTNRNDFAAQNSPFETTGNSFIDFTETNPFDF